MSDASRRPHRGDSRQLWEESDRRGDRNPPRDRDRDRERDRDRDRGRDSGRDRRGYRSRSRGRRDNSDNRSRSPDRRYRDRDFDNGRGRGRGGDRGSGRGWDRDDPRRQDDRDGRDRRRGPDDRDSRPSHPRDQPRRSQSPFSSLPTRSRPEKQEPPISPKRRDSRNNGNRVPDRMDEAEDGENPVEEEQDPDLAAMQAMMGFGNFGSTKGKHVSGNNAGGLRKEKKSEYRQYMNRQGGFNRPLSPGR